LVAASESLSIGFFVQAAGTNMISEALVLGGDQYWGPGRKYGSTYDLERGVLVASNIAVGGCSMFVCRPGSSGGAYNPGTFSLAGQLVVTNTSQRLGALALSQGPSPSPSTITLSSGSVLKFRDSSSQTWSTNALLVVVSWEGSMLGGGSSQLVFGTDGLALTPAQLAQIRFINPAPLPPGSYGAMILPTGEVVPNVPWLYSTTSEAKFILKWTGPFLLQTATNLQGPWASILGAPNAYTNDLAGARAFFRLAR
jgi:hypothetical protein